MEHLENDMDDLFQKAGELYPLKITGSDWDAVAGKLQNEDPGDMHELTGVTGTTSRRRKWLLILLLIPLGMGIYYFSGNLDQGKQNSISAKGKGSSADQKEISLPVAGNQMPSEEAAGKSKASAIDNSKANAADINKAAKSDNAVIPSRKKMNPYNSSGNAALLTNSHKTTNTSGGKTFTSEKGLNRQNHISTDANSKSDLNSNQAGAKETKTMEADKKSVDDTSPSAESLSKAAVAAAPSVLSTQQTVAANHSDKTESVKKVSADSAQGKNKSSKVSKQAGGFYVGLFAGPDVSTVKFQQVNNLGFSLGAMIGYRFNNRLSVETGVTWDKKYYYSNGEYYKKGGIPLPPTTTVDGSCSMFEIPVNIRYDFATKKNHGFFAKAGLSSYLMTSEQYTFNSSLYPYPYEVKNDTLKNNIFSILQISGGYERAINNKTKMRVEPYVKIPLQGIGKGDMPIASFGIYIGITHSFR